MAKKIGKIDFKKVAMNSVIAAGAGAVAQIASEAINMTDPQNTDFIMIGAGIILPELVKMNEAEVAGNALIAVGAYRLAERNDLAGKLGLGLAATAAASGINYGNIGSGWNQSRTVYANKVNGSGKKEKSKPAASSVL